MLDRPQVTAQRLRATVAVCAGAAFGIFACVAVAGLSRSWIAGVVAGVGVAAVAAWALWARVLFTLDEGAASRSLRLVSVIAAAGALVALARLAVFMVAPAHVGCSSMPFSDFEVHHSCVSAYFVAAEAAGRGANVYDPALYDDPASDPAAVRTARMLGPFRIDVYEYPPPFLELPRVLRLVAPDFLAFRALWFGLTSAVALAAMIAVCGVLGSAAGTRALLLTPLVWLSVPMLSTVQKGNVQLLVIALAMLAMVLFARSRPAQGGALLAFVTVSKLFPGLLGVYLLARRSFRAAGWTALFAGAFVALALIDLGTGVLDDFRRHLPGLLSGEAFPAFRNPKAVAINHSIPGIVFKLKLFGIAGMSFATAKAVGWIYTVLATGLTILLARRPLPEGEAPLVWMTVLILAVLRSPFLPQAYAAVPPLWLLVLLSATAPQGARTLGWTLAGWLALNSFWPLDLPFRPQTLAVLTAVPQLLSMVLAGAVVRRALAVRATLPPLVVSPGLAAPR